MRQPTSRDARRPFRKAPLRRCYAECYALLLTLVFHDGNNHGRKLATILVVGVWALLEVGAAFGSAELPNQFLFLRLVVGVIIGRMWGIEFNNLAGIELQYSDRDDGGDDGDN